MIGQVEELSPELHTHALAKRQRTTLNARKIRVHEARPVNRCARGRAKFSGGSRHKRAGVEPVLESVNLGGTVGAAGFGAGLIGIADQVWARICIAVIREKHARRVAAVNYEQGESRRDPLDKIQLPVPEDGIRRATPIAAELPAFSERQIVENAGGEAVVEIELRQPPVQLLRSGQRIVNRARVGT